MKNIKGVLLYVFGIVVVLSLLFVFTRPYDFEDIKKKIFFKKYNIENLLINYHLVQDNAISVLEIPENSLNLFLYFKEDIVYTSPSYYIVERLNGDMSYGELFRIKNPYLICKYLYVNKNWYINKADMKKCSKDKALQEINRLVSEVNNHFKTIESNKDSWGN